MSLDIGQTFLIHAHEIVKGQGMIMQDESI